MNKLFVIKDKTDANKFKPFISIHKTEQSVSSKVAQMKSRLSKAAQELITYEAVNVADFDANKKHVYVIFDKTKGLPTMSMVFDFASASKKVEEIKKSVSVNMQKQVFTKMVELES